jgi:ribosome-binding factor A
MSIRTERVAEEIKKVLSERLLRGLRDPLPGFVSIAAVEVTADFSWAKVHVAVIGTPEEKKAALAVLHDNKGALRSEVGKNVRLRQTPDLRFLLDESGERASRVLSLLDEIRAADAAKAEATKRADAAPASTSDAPSTPSRGRTDG